MAKVKKKKARNVKVICVTGSVCSGKTTIAKALAEKMGRQYLDVGKIIDLFKTDVAAGYDRKRKCKEINVDNLARVLLDLIKTSKRNLVVDSHLSHYIPAHHVECCVVCHCGLKKLRARLRKRGYDELKIRENLDAEIFDVCLVEALEFGHRVVSIDTTSGFDAGSAVKRINLNKWK